MITLTTLLSRARKINREIEKETKSTENTVERTALTDEQKLMCINKTKALVKKREFGRLIEDLKTALELREEIAALEQETGETLLFAPQGTKQNYFITIRPDTSKVQFIDFYNDVKKFTDRKCFNAFKLSFEQKGVTTENIGSGFHVHIVASMKQRSKGEVLRDTQSAFKGYTAANCIEVLTTRNPDELVDNYLVNYISEDGHKAPTKEMDALWRKNLNIDALYSSSLPIKSVLATSKKVITTKVTFV